MCASRARPELDGLELADVMDFEYTSKGDTPTIDNVDDEKEFEKTHEALKMLGFGDDDVKNIYKIMAAILHLGNVKISPGSGRGDSETSQVRQEDASLPVVAKLLEVDESQLRLWLCKKQVSSGRETFRGDLKPVEVS